MSPREPYDTPTAPSYPLPPPAPRTRWPWVVGLLIALVVAWRLFGSAAQPKATGKGAHDAARSVPVVAVSARQGNMPVTLAALGTVTAFNTVTVRSRVDGQIVRIGFQEGQFVAQGDVLLEIDPRPFEAQLKQAEGQLARDQAQLRDAQINRERYADLLAKGFVSKQQFDDQVASVGQLQGAVKMDEGLIDTARLQVTYAKITAPIGGRVGLRLVDIGNMVHASDATGVAVITQVQPITVVFTVPEDRIPPILKKLAGGGRLPVEAYDRAGKTKLADGTLVTADNQIDPTTGTIKLKAEFDNHDHGLFPNQFVNVKLLLDTRAGTIIVPTAAIQRGTQGTFVYVVKPDQSAEIRKVTLGVTQGLDTSIDDGLAAGDRVVVEGADKLRAGTKVELHEPDPTRPAPAGA